MTMENIKVGSIINKAGFKVTVKEFSSDKTFNTYKEAGAFFNTLFQEEIQKDTKSHALFYKPQEEVKYQAKTYIKDTERFYGTSVLYQPKQRSLK